MQAIADGLISTSVFLWDVEFWILNNFLIVWFATAWLFWTTVGIYLLKTKPVVRKACRDALKAMWD
jgi:hypothetical protein